MILPTSILDIIEEANDYYFPTLTQIYLKFSRGLITFLTVFLTPVFLLFMQNLNWLPEVFRFVAIRDTVNIPLVFQLLMLELAIDGLRLAALNTPSMLSTPLSVIAGIVMANSPSSPAGSTRRSCSTWPLWLWPTIPSPILSWATR